MLYSQKHIAECSEVVQIFPEIISNEIHARRNARRKNVELSRFHSENEYLEETFVISFIFFKDIIENF